MKVMQNKLMQIAIDGPAAAGKSTVAKIVANKLACVYIDTGAMYRALTLKVLKEGIPVHDEAQVMEVLNNLTIKLSYQDDGQQVLLNGVDVTDSIRTDEVSNHVSYIAEHPLVRGEMVFRQQQLAAEESVVMDGRDIGTHVLPHATVKIFLHASVEERAKRRYDENIKKGFTANLEKLKEDIKKRDEIDTNRRVSPLVKADDAIEIDTTSQSITGVARKILNEIKKTTI